MQEKVVEHIERLFERWRIPLANVETVVADDKDYKSKIRIYYPVNSENRLLAS